MTGTVTIARRFIGPPGSANGGYACGLTAAPLTERVADGGAVEVTLTRPPPVDRPLLRNLQDATTELHDGELVVARARRATLDVELPAPVSPHEAARAARRFDLAAYHELAPFPTCFTCGPDRTEGDGLRIFPAEVRPHLVAWPWTPDDAATTPAGEVDPALVWAALDCPSGLAWYHDRPPVSPHVLGRMTVAIERLPRPGEPLVAAGWVVGEDGRKRLAGSALWTADGRVVARNLATWIALTDEQIAAFAPSAG